MEDLIIFCDACVLYPAPIRDLIIELALNDFYQPKWSNRVHDEWINNLLANRSDLLKSRIENIRNLMNNAILDCLVDGFEEIEKTIQLPDPNDNHILAAAIVSKSKFIITYNLKDFPETILKPHAIRAIHPDNFFMHVLKNNEDAFFISVKNCHARLRNPPKTMDEYLINLSEKHNLNKTVYLLQRG